MATRHFDFLMCAVQEAISRFETGLREGDSGFVHIDDLRSLSAVLWAAEALCDATEGTLFSDDFGEHYRVPRDQWEGLADAMRGDEPPPPAESSPGVGAAGDEGSEGERGRFKDEDWPLALQRLNHCEPGTPDQGCAVVGVDDLAFALDRLAHFASVAMGNAAVIGQLEARATQAEGENERLREALKEVLRDAELGNFLRERCAYSYGNGYSEPREYSIAWEWQQRTPNDSSGAALAEQIAEHFANVAEVEAELGDELQPWDRNPVLAARAALQEPRS